jgi:hypothetical protein
MLIKMLKLSRIGKTRVINLLDIAEFWRKPVGSAHSEFLKLGKFWSKLLKFSKNGWIWTSPIFF